MTLLSHAKNESRFAQIRNKIAGRKDLVELLQQLQEFELGKFLIERGGLNGYWTHYAVTYPQQPRKPVNALEQFLFEKAPTMLATQQRFAIFKQQLQKRVRAGAHLASVPCGLMAELLDLELLPTCKLTGIDLDAETMAQAEQYAESKGLSKQCEFLQRDAWNLQLENRFDVMASNGLSIYETDDQKVVELYRQFFRALKPGGYLITSFLTWPPIPGVPSEWKLEKVNRDDALLQKVVFGDVLDCKWQVYRSTETVKQQLSAAGFTEIELFFDEASIFPTVVARKPKSSSRDRNMGMKL